MKKLLLICAFAVAGVSSASAIGVGVVFGGSSGGWNSMGDFNGGVGLSLGFGDISQVDWELAARISFRSQKNQYSYFRIAADADWHLLRWTPIDWFQLYLGLGPYAAVGIRTWDKSWSNQGSQINIDFGGRLPLGARFMIADLVDIWLAFVPSIGLNIGFGNSGSLGLGGGIGGELGVRFWF